jgi:trk system potassium uptake protein TrkH
MSALVLLVAGLLGLLAAALLLPALVAAVTGTHADATVFLATAGMVAFLAGGLFLSVRGRVTRISRLTLFGFVLLAWIAPLLIGALPIARLGGISLFEATFEAVSGLTTTGATVFPAIDELRPALVFWRAELNWLGGLLTLLLIFTLLGPAGIASTTLPVASLADLRRSTGLAVGLVAVYATATLAFVLLLLLAGLPTLDAVCLALSAISTGGFMPRDGTLAIYANPLGELILAAAMLAGATSFLWRLPLGRRGDMVRDYRESRAVILVAAAIGLVYALILVREQPFDSAGENLRQGLVAGASLVSTTGFQPGPSVLAALPVTLALIVVFFGGATFSAAGGLKYLRVAAMFIRSIEELRRLVYPHAVRAARLDKVTTDIPAMKAIWSHLALAITVFLGAALLLMAGGLAFEGSLVAALAAFTNTGPLYAAGWAEGSAWPHYGNLAWPSQLVLMATMILGRIEVLALFGALAAIVFRRS